MGISINKRVSLLAFLLVFCLLGLSLNLTSYAACSLSAITIDKQNNPVGDYSFENNNYWIWGNDMGQSNDTSRTGIYSAGCKAKGQESTDSITKEIQVEPNTKYLLSGYIYRTDDSITAYIDMNNCSNQPVLTANAADKWQYVSALWDSGNSTSIKIRLCVKPSGTNPDGITGDVWFDDITLATLNDLNDSSINDSIVGDVNGDSFVNIADVTMLQKHLANYSTLDNVNFKSFDINSDSEINIKDVTDLQKSLTNN